MYFDDLAKVLKEDYFVEEEIKPESRFKEDLGIDSLMTMQLLLDLEEKFEITVQTEDTEGITTVADAVKLVETKIKEKE